MGPTWNRGSASASGSYDERTGIRPATHEGAVGIYRTHCYGQILLVSCVPSDRSIEQQRWRLP